MYKKIVTKDLTLKLAHCGSFRNQSEEQNAMTKTINHDDRGKTVQGPNVDELLKKLETARETFSHEGRWIDWLSESVPNAFDEYLQISSDLRELSEQLRKNQKKGTHKSTIEALSRKAQAELTKTLDSVLEISALLKKRVCEASRIDSCLVDELEGESDLVREAVESIKRSLGRSCG